MIIKVDVITISENILTFYACNKNSFFRPKKDFFVRLRIDSDRGEFPLNIKKKIFVGCGFREIDDFKKLAHFEIFF